MPRITVDDLSTPHLVVDMARCKNNIEKMRNHIHALGPAIRPHVKTTKCPPLTRILFNGETGPITVSTLAEAEFFLEDGFTDILYAVGIIESKLPRVLSLIRNGADIVLVLDSFDAARAVGKFATAHDVRIKVLIEIDCDRHRAGIRADNPNVLELAKLLDSQAGTNFDGFMTHAGESYNCHDTQAIHAASEEERNSVVRCAEIVRAHGLLCKTISVGSTPTATFATDLSGVTEVRAGVFVFQDLFQTGLGVCTMDEIAISVLTSVIGRTSDNSALLIDAGALALSKDRGTANQKVDRYFGVVCDRYSCNPIDGLVVESVNQEHGIVRNVNRKTNIENISIGSRLRIYPNHACMTAAAYDQYAIMDAEGRIQEFWNRCNGW